MSTPTTTSLSPVSLSLPLRVLGYGNHFPGDTPYKHIDLLQNHVEYKTWPPQKIKKLADKTLVKFGLNQRYIVSPPSKTLCGRANTSCDTTSETLALAATEKALASSPTTNIAALIHGTTTSSRYTGSQAPAILGKLGSQAPGIELKAGCSTSLASLHTALAYLNMGYENVMVSCAETLSKTINPNQLETLFLLADGAASVWLEKNEISPQCIVNKCLYHTDGAYIDTYTTPGRLPPNHDDLDQNNYTMKGDGQLLREQAKRRYQQMLDAFFPERDALNKVKWLIPHQINRALIDEIVDENNIRANIQWDSNDVGNLGGTSVLYSLTQLINSGQLKRGDDILLMSVGGGLSFAMQHWTWLE